MRRVLIDVFYDRICIINYMYHFVIYFKKWPYTCVDLIVRIEKDLIDFLSYKMEYIVHVY